MSLQSAGGLGPATLGEPDTPERILHGSVLSRAGFPTISGDIERFHSALLQAAEHVAFPIDELPADAAVGLVDGFSIEPKLSLGKLVSRYQK